MGRRGNMRSRPGLLFVVIFVICLVIVYLSWRSMSPGIKVKETYSAKMQTLLDESSKWRNIGENREGENHDRDPDYDLDKGRPKKVIQALRQYDLAYEREDKNKQDFKARPTEPRISEVSKTDKKEFYRQPNVLITETVKSMERFVHLDLKGAAPKITYFRTFIPLVKKLGATGLLIEYEDMFPYSGSLKHISANNAYSVNDLKELLELARVNNLKVMPLVQAFGHMEFVLKSGVNNLRESNHTPQVIDITQNASYSLISEMVKQILNAHPDATHLHIGCDEVYELGRGASGIEMKSKKLTESHLFLRHVRRVADIVRSHDERNVIPVMWDDELRKTSLQDIEDSKLPSLVEIMVWHYTKFVLRTITSETWDKYAKLFKSVWIASAFKGATGPRQLFTEPQYHIQNHFSWLDAIVANKHRITFRGVALTGWQRYDHFATLCELLPVAVPSLAVCLATMVNAGFTKDIHEATSKLIQCDQPIEMTFPVIDNKTNTAIVSQDCRFPSSSLYHAVQELYGYIEGMPSIKHRLDGWLSDYQIAHHFSSPGQLRVLSSALTKQSSGLSMVSNALKTILSEIYSDDTVDEWMDENIIERQRRNKELQDKIKSFENDKSWPARPLSADSDARKRSTINEVDNDNNKLQYGSNDQSKDAVPVQSTLQYGKTKYQTKLDVQNEQIVRPKSYSHSQWKSQSENPFPVPLVHKTPNKMAEHRETEPKDLATGSQELPPISDPKLSKGDTTLYSKQSDVLLENVNKKNRRYSINQEKQGRIEENHEEPREFKLEPKATTGIRNPQLSEMRKSHAYPLDENDKLQHDFFRRDKNDIPAKRYK